MEPTLTLQGVYVYIHMCMVCVCVCVCVCVFVNSVAFLDIRSCNFLVYIRTAGVFIVLVSRSILSSLIANQVKHACSCRYSHHL